MPATQKKTSRTANSPAAHTRAKQDAHRLERISKTLETAQKDLGSVGGSLGTGARDLRRDVSRMLRDARRDLEKMRRALQRDVERLQKDLTAAARGDGARRRTGTSRRPRRGTSRSSR